MHSDIRLHRLDNVRGILIVLVVLGHIISYGISLGIKVSVEIYESLYVFIYAFHMPLFIFISGYFHRNKKILNKVFYYLVLYVALSLFLYVTKLVLGIETDDFSLFTDVGGVQWYLLALAVFIAVTYVFRNFNRALVLGLAIILALVVGYDDGVNDFLSISRIIVFFPYYWAGYCLQGNKKFESVLSAESDGDKPQNFAKRRDVILRIAGIVIIVLWALFCFLDNKDAFELKPFFTARRSYNGYYGESIDGLLLRLLAYALGALTSLAIIFIAPCGKIKGLTVLGERSISVYFWHRPFIVLLDFIGILDLFFCFGWGVAASVVLAVIFSAIFGQNIFYKPFVFLRKKFFEIDFSKINKKKAKNAEKS